MALSIEQVQNFIEGIRFNSNSTIDLDLAEQVGAGYYENYTALKNACLAVADTKYCKRISKMDLPID